jgi:hypothetical protein
VIAEANPDILEIRAAKLPPKFRERLDGRSGRMPEDISIKEVAK